MTNQEKDIREKLGFYIDAWWNRTLPMIILETGKRIPPPTRRVWKNGVKKDLERLLDLQKEEYKRMIEKNYNDLKAQKGNDRKMLEKVRKLLFQFRNKPIPRDLYNRWLIKVTKYLDDTS